MEHTNNADLQFFRKKIQKCVHIQGKVENGLLIHFHCL